MHAHDAEIAQFADDVQIWKTGKKRDIAALISSLETLKESGNPCRGFGLVQLKFHESQHLKNSTYCLRNPKHVA